MPTVTRIAFILAYLAGAAAAVLFLDANTGDGEWAVAIWAVASVVLGLGTGQPGFALLAFLAIPFAVPFGYPDNYQYSEPIPIWWSAAVLAFFSAGVIFFVALLRRIAQVRRRRPAAPSGR
jgi:hypothetical protein